MKDPVVSTIIVEEKQDVSQRNFLTRLGKMLQAHKKRFAAKTSHSEAEAHPPYVIKMLAAFESETGIETLIGDIAKSRGLCLGISASVLTGICNSHLGHQGIYTYEWFVGVRRLISAWQESDPISPEDINNIKVFLALLSYFENIERYETVPEGEFGGILMNLNQKKIHKEYSIGGSFTHNDIIKILLEDLAIENKLIIIGSYQNTGHAMGLLRIDKTCFFIDANQPTGEIIDDAKHVEKFADAIFRKHRFPDKHIPQPISWEIFGFDAKQEYPSQQELLKKTDLLVTMPGAVTAKLGKTSPLFAAAHIGCQESLRFYLSSGFDPNVQNGAGQTPLIILIHKGHLDAAMFFLQTADKLQLDHLDQHGMSALMYAMRAYRPGLICLLLDKGANPKLKNPDGRSTLMDAIFSNKLEKVIEVVSHPRIDLDDKGYKHFTPLTYAYTMGLDAIVQLLILAGANPNTADVTGKTPLMLAACQGDEKMVRRLVDAKADISCVDSDNKTALMLAAYLGNEQMIACLIALKARPDQCEQDWTALAVAAAINNVSSIITLISHGADPNFEMPDGSTALSAALENCHPAAVIALLKGGADPAKPNRLGETALSLAADESNPNPEILRILQEHLKQSTVVKPRKLSGGSKFDVFSEDQLRKSTAMPDLAGVSTPVLPVLT